MTDRKERKQHVEAPKESVTDAPGVVRVASDVIGWIAALAAVRIDGVYGLVRPRREGSDNILRSSHVHKGVTVRIEPDRSLSLDVWIVVSSGNNVQDVAKNVQQHVAEMVERMLNLHVVDVNVFITHVAYA